MSENLTLIIVAVIGAAGPVVAAWISSRRKGQQDEDGRTTT